MTSSSPTPMPTGLRPPSSFARFSELALPLDFMRLPLIAMVGFVLYNEPLLLSVLVGSAVIFYANWLNVRSEQRATQRSL